MVIRKAYWAVLAEGDECSLVAGSVLNFAATNAGTIACWSCGQLFLSNRTSGLDSSERYRGSILNPSG
jgi:hypothetical protein